ncbi:unnamed protein product [Periconia digitata]|uniref:Uncharacterized protein n=1 Tax=Periconia digitata TaxID=1303443 RepID=A0A9W4XWB0_9PLEO|nr:unnamed protein product [Periconia digitata]
MQQCECFNPLNPIRSRLGGHLSGWDPPPPVLESLASACLQMFHSLVPTVISWFAGDIWATSLACSFVLYFFQFLLSIVLRCTPDAADGRLGAGCLLDCSPACTVLCSSTSAAVGRIHWLGRPCSHARTDDGPGLRVCQPVCAHRNPEQELHRR